MADQMPARNIGTAVHPASKVLFRRWVVFLILAVSAWLVGPGAGPAGAQYDPLESIGILPFTAQLPVEHGFINLANSDLHLEIPLGSFPQRGGPPVTLALMYDSSIWAPASGFLLWQPGNVPSPTNYPNPSSGDYSNGWRLHVSVGPGCCGFGNISIVTCKVDGTPDYYTYYPFTWIDNGGTWHRFEIRTTQGFKNQCGDFTSMNQPNGDALALDLSGYHMYVSFYSQIASIYAPDGTLVGARDTNGNTLSWDSNGNLTDTLGRTPVTSTVNGNTRTYAVLNSQGGRSTYTATWASIDVHTNFASAGSTLQEWISPPDSPLRVIQSIQLPDNTTYSFKYDCDSSSGAPACGSPAGQSGYYGQLISMTLPTGGQITYSYSNFDDSMGASSQYLPHITRGLSTRTTPDGTWHYNPHVIFQCTGPQQTGCQQQLTVTKPSGDSAVYTFNIDNGAWPIQAQYYTGAVSAANLLATRTQTFNYGARVKTASTITLPTPGGASVSQTTHYAWDANYYGNLTQEQKWNFYTGTLPSTPDRTTAITYLSDSNSNYASKNIFTRPASVTITDKNGNTVEKTVNSYDGSSLTSITGVAHHDDTNYGTGNTVRGNLTQVQRLVSGTSNYLTTSMAYDTTGQVTSSTDANNNRTTYSYADNFFNDNGANPPQGYTPSTPTNAYLTNGTLPLIGSTTFGYYYGSGKQASSKDQNGQITYGHFQDPLDRPTTTNFPDGGWTLKRYFSPTLEDTFRSITDTTPSASCSGCQFDRITLDAWGRVFGNTLESDPEGYESVATYYDSNGRVYQVSNPYRNPNTDPTYGLTTYSYDGLDRVTKVTHPDGSYKRMYYGSAVVSGGGRATQGCSGCGLGYPVFTVDEASKVLQAWYDGFGNLIELDEPTSSGIGTANVTAYTYDLLGNLTGVTQSGSRPRTFNYDALSRLTQSSTPESGTTNFYYTTSTGGLCSGNPSLVCRRTDARSITTTYTYDALNRLTQKSYSDGTTPYVVFGYDNPAPWSWPVTNYIGRLTFEGVYTAAGSTGLAGGVFSYDPMGRVLHNEVCALFNCESTTYASNGIYYTYDFLGDLTSITDGMGHKTSYSYDTAARVTGATSSWVDSTHPGTLATVSQYWPNGAMELVKYGNNLTELRFENNRLQLCRINVNTGTPTLSQCNSDVASGTVQDFYTNYNEGTADNGNVALWAAVDHQTFRRTYTYDQVNRLTSMSDSDTVAPCLGLSWSYDAWGNRTAQTPTKGTCATSSLIYDANNRIAGSGVVYDAAGNMTNDGTHSYTYDGENRITAVDGGSTASYVYDAEGRRVGKTNSAGTRDYVYDLGDEVLSETATSGLLQGYVYLHGGMLAEYGNGTTYFAHLDHLGSTRLLTALNQSIYDSMDYLPFGEQISGDTGTSHKFTGKERDAESGLDDFRARYYSSQYGRFMSADSTGYSSLRNPQAWNLYAYTLNNPLKYSDPSGHTVQCANDTDLQKCQSAIQAALASEEAAKRITLNTTTTQHSFLGLFHWTTTTTTIGISGDINSFRQLSDNANKLADLVSDKRTFMFAISPTYTSFGGAELQTPGGMTQTPSQGFPLPSGVTGAATVAPNPSPFDQDTWGLLGGYSGPIPGANVGETTAHELLGHLWGEVFGGHVAGTAANKADAVMSEDAVRATDPTRGQKVTHGGEQVIPTP